MAICNECKHYFKNPEDADTGDCVQKKVDPRQTYFQAVPVEAEQDAGSCDSFQKR